MLRRILLLLSCCVLVGCSSGDRGGFDSEELALYEATLRKIATGSATDAKGVKVVYYVAFTEGELPKAFFDRLQNHSPAIEPMSNYREDNRKVSAQLVNLQREIQWLDSGKPRVFVLSYPAGESLKCGTPYPVPLRRENGQWVAVD